MADDGRNDFVINLDEINLDESDVVEPGFQLLTPGSADRYAMERARLKIKAISIRSFSQSKKPF